MFDHSDWMWGMHWGWWIVWIAVVVVLVALLMRNGASRGRRDTPLDILERRYANGEISTEDYEERKERLLRDQR